MSNLVFMPPAGLGWNIKKAPTYKTLKQDTVSARGQLRIAEQVYPIWEFEFIWNYLLGAEQKAGSALQTLMGFYMARQGAFDSFLFTDPNDNAVTAQNFGTGNGSAASFQLVRNIGTGQDIVQNTNGDPLIYVGDGSWKALVPMAIGSNTNSILHSQVFSDAAWLKSNVTETDNTTAAPDGTTTGCTLHNGTAVSHSIRQDVNTGVTQVTWSCYCKFSSGSGTGLTLEIFDNSGTAVGSAGFLLTGGGAGTTTAITGPTTANIISVGSGWYLCSITLTTTTATSRFEILMPDLTDYFVWGAQVELKPAAHRYIATTTAAASSTDITSNTNGLILFASAPGNTYALTWTGSYYYRLHFLDDNLDFTEMFQQIWELRSVKMESLIL